MDVRIQGPAGADITVLDVLARIEDQRSVAGQVRVRCPELVHDQVEPDYQVDFAQSGTALAKLDIAIDQSLNRIRDLPLHEAAHLGDLAGYFLQIGIERLGGVIDSGGGDVSHLRYPKRPVM